MIAKALAEQGFDCQLAVDGDEAARTMAGQRFDLLITDLKMPNRNGHALVRDVLQVDAHPVIIVHTGVLEPKLATDLLTRGVDDVVYKPTDVNVLAVKARAMVDRRHAQTTAAATPGDSPLRSASHLKAESQPAPVGGPVTAAEINEKLAKISTVLPISHAALDVYQMTRSCDWRLSQIAAAIQRDAALAAEVLRLANSSYYNPSSRRVVSLDQAVMAIGQKRIGELAVAVNALAAVTPNAVPWMNLEVAWKRSMAAGIALEALVELGGHQEIEEGLPLSAVLYPLGRIVLAMMFPDLYQSLLAEAWRSGLPLHEHERKVLPMSHAATLAQLLSAWRIPPDVALPLRHAADDFAALARLAEPLRTKAELMKVAVVLGRLAVDQWETWDTVELPSTNVLQRLRIANVEQLVANIRADLVKLAGFCPGSPGDAKEQREAPPRQSVAYCNFTPGQNDLLADLLPSMGFQPAPIDLEELRHYGGNVLVNGLDSAATRFAAHRGAGDALVVTMRDRADVFAKYGRTAVLPCSFGSLRDAAIDLFGGQPEPGPGPRPAVADHSDQENDLIGVAHP